MSAARPGRGIRGGAPKSPAAKRRRNMRLRFGTGKVVLFTALIAAAAQLLWIQGFSAAQLSAQSAEQHAVPEKLPAMRGPIIDRFGKRLAFTSRAMDLNFQPAVVRRQLAAAHAKDPDEPEPDQRLREIAKEIHRRLGNAAPSENELLDRMRGKVKGQQTFTYLARRVAPEVAQQISDKFHNQVGVESKEFREYPGGSLAANMLGVSSWDGHGLAGLEATLDAQLAGTDGSVLFDRGSDGAEIPGSRRNRHPAVNGATVALTLDSDLQYYVQQQVQQAKELSLARNASAVVLDAKTGQVLAMANDSTFDPSHWPADHGEVDRNLSITTPFEPGSVNKIVTAAAAIENHLTTPGEVHKVPGAIQIADVTVHDAWQHGVLPYTTTGIFGKSSNVGTLMLAKRVGEARYAEMLRRFGLGRRTQVGLPGESAGMVPPRAQWSGSTFANLPIGQGLQMTLLQMTGMYQAVANDGVRVPPRIVKSITDATGRVTVPPTPAGVRVVSAQTAQTLRAMFQAVVQKDPMGYQSGTGASAAVDGYQIAGKTGTAQQVNPNCKCYSDSDYWITFAGMAPADHPRYVIGMMLDAPQRSVDGSGAGGSAAPLFHNIASWLLQRDGVPLSPEPPRKLILQATHSTG